MSDRWIESEMQGPEGPPSAQLLRLTDYDPRKPTRIIAELRAYWQGLRRGRAIPLRTDVDAKGIARALDYAFILERMAPGAARFRLAGRHLIDLMGMEVRGMPLCAVLNPRSRGRLSDVLEAVFKAPQQAEIELYAAAEYGRPELTARMLLLPLKSDLGDVTRVLGCLVSEGRVGIAPRRFDLVSDKMVPIIEGGKTIAPSPSAMPFAPPLSSLRSQSHSAGALTTARSGLGHDHHPDPSATRRAAFRIVSSQDDDPYRNPLD